MKKNVMMRIAAVLLVAVLFTSSTISGTFAKYVTSDNGADRARVAKWGVSVQVGGDLYGADYLKGDAQTTPNTKIEVDATVDQISVSAEAASPRSNVVAPGTKNEEGLTFSITGTPEVDFLLETTVKAKNIFLAKGQYGVMVKATETISATNFASLVGANPDEKLYYLNGSDYVVADAFDANVTQYYRLEDYTNLTHAYYPVVYAKSGDAARNSQEDSLNAIAEDIVKLVNSTTYTKATDSQDAALTVYTASNTYDANVDLKGLFTDKLDDENITWTWAYEVKNGNDVVVMYDQADTILGDLIAGNTASLVKYNDSEAKWKAPVAVTDYCTETAFDISFTVTQVD